MEIEIFEILVHTFRGYPDELSLLREASENIDQEYKNFTKWKDDPNCPFSTYFEWGSKPKVMTVGYTKNGKNYNIDDVYKFYNENIKNK